MNPEKETIIKHNCLKLATNIFCNAQKISGKKHPTPSQTASIVVALANELFYEIKDTKYFQSYDEKMTEEGRGAE